MIPRVTHLQAFVLASLAHGPALAKVVRQAVKDAGASHTPQAFHICAATMQRGGLIRMRRLRGPQGGPGREGEYSLTSAGRKALQSVRGFYRELETVA